MIRAVVSHVEKAKSGWKGEVPDWVEVLAKAAEDTSQGRVSRMLGISSTQISQIIGATYKGNTENAETLVRGRLMKETVTCPALGEIGPDVCKEWQVKCNNFSAGNMLRVRMARACRRCPIFKKENPSE